MHSIVKTISVFVLFVIGLAGCNTNDEAALQDNRKDNALPIGYYSNENHENKGGNAIILDGSDNDGPLVEIMDHTLGKESETNKRVMQSGRTDTVHNTLNPVIERNEARLGEPMIGGRDTNYHGHINTRNATERKSYEHGYDGKTVEKITAVVQSVPNIKEARAVIHDNKVIVGMRLANKGRAQETKRKVHDAIKPYVQGKKLYYVTNESRYYAIKTLDQQLKKGGNKEEIQKDIERIIQSLEQRRQ